MVALAIGFGASRFVEPDNMPNPIGTITLWSGLVANIPAGWSLCDGSGGTPDLRSKFVQGAGGALNPGDIGGDANHTHVFTDAGHMHGFGAVVQVAGAGPSQAVSGPPPGTDSAVADGSNANADNAPEFHALAYIMHTG